MTQADIKTWRRESAAGKSLRPVMEEKKKTASYMSKQDWKANAILQRCGCDGRKKDTGSRSDVGARQKRKVLEQALAQKGETAGNGP